MWPQAWPHGAHVETTNIRYTITVPVEPEKNVKREELERVKDRLKALYDESKQGEKRFKIQDAGGLVHKNPHLVFRFYKEFESFRALFPFDREEMEAFLREL